MISAAGFQAGRASFSVNEAHAEGVGLNQKQRIVQLVQSAPNRSLQALRGPRALGAALVALARLRGSRAQAGPTLK